MYFILLAILTIHTLISLAHLAPFDDLTNDLTENKYVFILFIINPIILALFIIILIHDFIKNYYINFITRDKRKIEAEKSRTDFVKDCRKLID